MMRGALAKGALALLLGVIAQVTMAQKPITNVIYVNGIQNTLEDAQATQLKIQGVLDSSPNHPIGVRRFFYVELVWNPIGWYDKPRTQADLSQDKMEMFLEKTAEEDFAASFQRLIAPYNQSVALDKTAAIEVVKYLDDMTPGNNSLETSGKINDDNMSATKRAIGHLVDRIKQLGSTVVIAHSQGNLIADLAWAKLVADYGDDAKRMMRLVNVANTSQFSVHGLNFTHSSDAALFSAATAVLAPDQSLETLPSSFLDWTRTTPATAVCARGNVCDFSIAPPTFEQISDPVPSPIGLSGAVDLVLTHSISITYLSTAKIQPKNPTVIPFTPNAERFVDRFEDFVYVASQSLDTVVTVLTCQSVLAGQSLGCEAVGENLRSGMVLLAPGWSNIAEASGGTSNRRVFIADTSAPGTFTVSLAGPGGTPVYRSIQVVVGTLAAPLPPDLVLQGASFAPTTVVAGAPFQVALSVLNRGGTSASSSTLAIRVNQSQIAPTGQIAATASVPSLGPNLSVPFTSINVLAPTVPGVYQVWATADTGATSGEGAAERANNDILLSGGLTVVAAPTLPDLVVQNIAFSPANVIPGGTVTVNFDIANLGLSSASASMSVIRVNQSTSSAAGANLASVSVGALAGGARSSYSAGVSAPTVPGSYRVWVIADNNNTSGQDASAIANDIVLASGVLTVSIPGAADIAVSTFNFSPTTVTAGVGVQIQFSVGNLGQGAANASTAAIRVNQSSTSASGTDLATVTVPGIAAGAISVPLTANIAAPTVPGTYRVWAVLDVNGTAGQTVAATANDAFISSAVLTVSPTQTGPRVDSFVVSPSAPSVGVPAVFTITGVSLPATPVLSFPGCAGYVLNGWSSTQQQYGCTPTQAGTNMAGTIVTATGITLYAFNVSVAPIIPAPGPSGLFVGYYSEDPTARNPQSNDLPHYALLVVTVPASGGGFSGLMDTKFLACQPGTDVGTISGTKGASTLSGTWSGTFDLVPQSGSFSGTYNATSASYYGDYTVAGGLQLVSVPTCGFQYSVYPAGTWEALPIGGGSPSTFRLLATGTQITWTAEIGTVMTMVSVIDELDALNGNSGAVKFLSKGVQQPASFNLGTVSGLVAGRAYIVSVTTATSYSQRTGAASVRVVR